MLIALGVVMIVLTLYVALVSHPPLGMALRETVFPSNINFAAITTIVGGTVGGYISYAGAHRLLDKGISGKEHIKEVSSAVTAGLLWSASCVMCCFWLFWRGCQWCHH